MPLVAGVAALAVLGALGMVVALVAIESREVDEPPSTRSLPMGATSVPVVVAAIIRVEGAAIVAFAPPGLGGRPLWDIPERDWGAVTFQSPSPVALEALDAWARQGEALLLETFPERHLVRLCDPERPAGALVMSASS